MARSEFDPFEHGLYKRFITAGDVLHTSAWNHAGENGDFVGTCRWCGGYLQAAPTVKLHDKMTWYEAVCLDCRRIIASPNGHMLRRSSRHDEMPSGFWASRAQKKEG